MQDFHHIHVAVHNAAKNYHNGITGLGEAIGHKNIKTFSNNLNPYDDAHRLTFVEFLHVLRETGDITLIRVLASMVGCKVERAENTAIDLAKVGSTIAKECAEAIVAAQQSCRNLREEEAAIKEYDEAIAVLAAAREMMIARRGM